MKRSTYHLFRSMIFSLQTRVSLVLPIARKGTLLDTSLTQCESYHGECNHGVTIQVWVGLDVLNKATVG